MKKTLILIALIVFLFSCEKEDPSTELIAVNNGETFDIDLTANWSTGYRWSWVNRSCITVADTINFEYVTQDPGLGGSAGTEIWTFLAKSPGEETLIFIYLPPGATGNEEGERMTFNVLVNG